MHRNLGFPTYAIPVVKSATKNMKRSGFPSEYVLEGKFILVGTVNTKMM